MASPKQFLEGGEVRGWARWGRRGSDGYYGYCASVPTFRLRQRDRGGLERSSADHWQLCGRVGLAGNSMLQAGECATRRLRMGRRLRLPCPIECQLGDGDPGWEPRGHVGVIRAEPV